MRAKIFFGAGLMLATTSICLAQRPSATLAPSGWQLAPPFELSSPTSAARASSPSPASASTATAPVVQAPPVQPSRDRTTTSKAPYVEGSVWVLTFIKTKSGLTDDYFKSITASLKPVYEEEKKQRLILDYKILSGEPAGDHDFNIILMVEYPNMAALEASHERAEPIIDKIIGPNEKRRDLATKRMDTRDILATKTMREIWLK
jgi:hypothetical protein